MIVATGIEAEAELPFAALLELAMPLRHHLDELTGQQADALRSALALAEDPPPNNSRLAACSGLLGLLRSAARATPLLVLIDDAQWLDAASRECIGYAARRLANTPVGLIATARPSTQLVAFPGELTLAGLARDDARTLLRAVAPELAPSTVESLLDACAGSPLALKELPALLSDAQRRGAAPFVPAPRPGGDLWTAFARRLAALTPPSRTSVVVAAVSFDRDVASLLDACRDLGLQPGAVEEADEAGVLVLRGNRFDFAHPLIRGVAYGEASAAERRRAHEALACRSDADSSAWHRAAAALGPSEEIATALEAAGRQAAARGAQSAAADALERAAGLSESADARAGRLRDCGLAAALGGDYERAAAVLESIEQVDQPQLRATVQQLLALVTLNGGVRDALSNHERLTEEGERIAALDPTLGAELHADAAVVATVAGDCDLALTSSERATALLLPDAPAAARCRVLAVNGMGLALRGRVADGGPVLERAAGLLEHVDPLSPAAQVIAFALHMRLCSGAARPLRDDVLALEAGARAAGGYGLTPYYLLVAADAAYRLGDWDAAEREIDDAITSAEYSCQRGPLSIALIVRARLHAACGRPDAARADADAGVEAALPAGYGATLLWAQAARGFLALGLSDAEGAIEELEGLEDLVSFASLEDPVIVPWAPDLVEAYSRVGREEDARRVATTLADQARRGSVPLAGALAARCNGVLSEDEIDVSFERACDLHEAAGAPFETARTMLAWGRRLHRARRRMEARERLRDAHARFERLGAQPWAESALAELRAAGGRMRRAQREPDELTAQEVRVARAVARGATNREVAAELFLSPKTIEFHLRLIYRKLGVRSRTQLAHLVADGGLERPRPPSETSVE